MVRDVAIDYLGPFGADPKSAAKVLAALLSNPDANLRKLAVEVLGKIDPDLAVKTPEEDSTGSKPVVTPARN